MAEGVERVEGVFSHEDETASGIPKTPGKKGRPRPQITKRNKIEVFRRDKWICKLSGRPVIFAPVIRHLEKLVNQSDQKPAYYHAHWSRRNAPLLDYLGATVDHIEAYCTGGKHEIENFATACNKCNTKKNSKEKKEYLQENPPHVVKGKYGEPEYWDGLSTLFLVLVKQDENQTDSDRAWLRAFNEAS